MQDAFWLQRSYQEEFLFITPWLLVFFSIDVVVVVTANESSGPSSL